MSSQQTPSTTPPIENRPPTPPPPVAQLQADPEYNEQFIETLAQRLMPRLMPEIMSNVHTVEPARSREKAFGMSLALAIVSIALLIPLTAIVLSAVTSLGGGMTAALIGIGVIGLVMVLINVLFNYTLFNIKS
jgi:hypothetical protein